MLTRLTAEAMRDIAHLLRSSHLASLRGILDDPESSANDRFVAFELLKNATISAAILAGPIAGMLAGVAVMIVAFRPRS